MENTGSLERGTYMKVVDEDGNFLTANPKQGPIAPLKKDADNAAIVAKINEIIAALKLSNIVANKE